MKQCSIVVFGPEGHVVYAGDSLDHATSTKKIAPRSRELAEQYYDNLGNTRPFSLQIREFCVGRTPRSDIVREIYYKINKDKKFRNEDEMIEALNVEYGEYITEITDNKAKTDAMES